MAKAWFKCRATAVSNLIEVAVQQGSNTTWFETLCRCRVNSIEKL